MLNNEELYGPKPPKLKAKDWGMAIVVVLAVIGGFNVLQWLTVDVLGLR